MPVTQTTFTEAKPDTPLVFHDSSFFISFFFPSWWWTMFCLVFISVLSRLVVNKRLRPGALPQTASAFVLLQKYFIILLAGLKAPATLERKFVNIHIKLFSLMQFLMFHRLQVFADKWYTLKLCLICNVNYCSGVFGKIKFFILILGACFTPGIHMLCVLVEEFYFVKLIYLIATLVSTGMFWFIEAV